MPDHFAVIELEKKKPAAPINAAAPAESAEAEEPALPDDIEEEVQ